MKKRIEYIDVTRGILSTLTVIRHSGITMPLSTVVPEFIFLSSLFYNTKLDFKEFLTKRVKVFLIPFIFFYVISYAFYALAGMVKPSITSMTDATDFFDIFTQKQLFNGPLWFLPALFWVQVIYYPILKYVRKIHYKFIISMGLGIAGSLLGYYEIFLPMYIDSALSLIPFFFFGNQIFKLKYLENKKFVWYLIFAFSGIVLLTLNYTIRVQATYNLWGNITDYLLSVIIITHVSIIILYVCKLLDLKQQFFSFLGQNSMLIMCSHHLIYRPIQLVAQDFIPTNILPYFVCIVTMIIIFAIAPFFNKYIPWAVGKIK